MTSPGRGRDLLPKPLLLPRESSRLFVHQAQLSRTGPTLKSWSFGKGTVIWKIWPAVLLHTLFAVAVVISSIKFHIYLGIPNVMLTVLGVVIGFVLAYRVSSGCVLLRLVTRHRVHNAYLPAMNAIGWAEAIGPT
jgi:hypothetical protein